jgi:uncharacterized protein YegL
VRVLIAVLVLVVTSISAGADPGLDLAILIDRSQSMSRYARVNGAMCRLAVDVLRRNAQMNAVEHRIAVISFASAATVDVPWTAVRGSSRPRIDDRDPGGGTDFLVALRAADRLFHSLPSDPARRRAIVLLTDGVPYVRGTDMRRYPAELRRFVEMRLADVSIDVVLPAVANGSLDQTSWAIHHTDALAADILATVHAVITRLAGTASVESVPSKTTPAVDEIVVPPYLELIVFDIFRASSGGVVEVFPPGSDGPIRKGDDGVEAVQLGEVLETLAIAQPRPGEWIVRKSHSDAHVRVRSEHFFPRGVLLEPSVASLALARDRRRIAYQVLDANAHPLEELNEYPLSLNVTLAAPDGRQVAMLMERDTSRGRAAFRSTREASCTSAGRYWTDVRVLTNDAAGRPLEIFRDRWSGFTVTPSLGPVQANAIASPAAAGGRSLLALWPFVAAAGAVIVACAILRRRKTRTAPPCLSDRSHQDER